MLKEPSSESPVIATNYQPFWVISGAVVVILAVVIWLVMRSHWQPFQGGYFQISPFMIMGVGYLGFWIFLITRMYQRKVDVAIYSDRIEVRRRKQEMETYPISALTGYYPAYGSRGGLSSIGLALGDKAVTISGTGHLSRFLSYLEAGGYTKLSANPEPPAVNRPLLILTLVIVVAAVIGGPVLNSQAQQLRDQHKGSETYTINAAELSGEPSYSRYKNGPYVTKFRLVSAPDFVFSFSRRDGYYTPPVGGFDVVILRYDYDVKIAHTREPSFWDKHFDWGVIRVVSLRSGDGA